MREVRIQELLQGMIGNVCWGIHYKRINMSISIGQPKLNFMSSDDPIRDRKIRMLTDVDSEYHFWAQYSYWKLKVLDTSGQQALIAKTSSSNKEKEKACYLLSGQKITSIEIDNKSAKTIIKFDLGAELIIRRESSEKKELWYVRGPEDKFVSVYSDGTYNYTFFEDDSEQKVEGCSINERILIGPRILRAN